VGGRANITMLPLTVLCIGERPRELGMLAEREREDQTTRDPVRRSDGPDANHAGYGSATEAERAVEGCDRSKQVAG